MFFGEEDSQFQNLPNEMIVEISSHVDLRGKQTARLVCRRWRWIFDHPDAGLLCFKQTKGTMTENSIQCLLKSELYIDHLVLKDVKVTWPSMTYSRNTFSPIRRLTLGSGNSDQSLKTILQYGCAQAESLTLDECFSHVRLDVLSRVLSGMRWGQFTELNLSVYVHTADEIKFPGVKSLKNPRENNVKGMELIFMKGRIPNLRVLNLDLFSYGKDDLHTGLTNLMSNFAIFLEHHSKTLKELRLEVELYSYCEGGILISQNVSAPLFSAEQQKSVARDLKLEYLDISTTHFDALFHLVPPCVWESENLTGLKCHPLCDYYGKNLNHMTATPSDTANPLHSVVQRSRNTLTNVTTTFIRGDIGIDPFELPWLESCPHLRELTITNCDKLLSVKLQLPTVKKLAIGLIINLESIENLSTWISQTFRNLETVQFSVRFTAVRQNSQFGWIQNLLVLPRLGEIGFWFTYYWFEESRYTLTGPNLIREYCSHKARLMFRGERQGGRQDRISSGSCLVKIL